MTAQCVGKKAKRGAQRAEACEGQAPPRHGTDARKARGAGEPRERRSEWMCVRKGKIHRDLLSPPATTQVVVGKTVVIILSDRSGN